MLSISSPSLKDYVHRGTQTDQPISPPRPSERSSARTVLQVSRVRHGYLPSSSQNVSNSTHSCSSAQLDAAYSHSLSSDLLSLSLSPTSLGTILPRVSKRRQLTYHRPTESFKSSNRLVSLPEVASSCSSRNELDASTLRVVSMPERHRPDMSLPENNSVSDCFEVSASSNNSYLTADDGLYSHLRVVSDPPNTPSPPSSPESVMIIANSMQLPEAFLRHKVESTAQAAFDEDEGWIAWASSPPRPIPALHGPLSLPYARCPSGAEGTIIEAPDDLSRMIWGLGADESQPSQPQKVATHQSQVNFPPRLQKTQAHQHSHNYVSHAPLSNVPARSVPILSDLDYRAQSVLYPQVLDTLGSRYPRNTSSDAAVLDSLMRTGVKTDPWNSVYRDSFIEDLRNFDIEGGLGLDWQTALERQSPQDADHKATDYLKPAAPPFVAAGHGAQHSYPRIFVERRSQQPPQIILPPPRLSAIEIAHKYRQQYQLKNALPTPPSSSSSQWSPYFSSHQVVSPDPVIHRSSRLMGQRELQQHLPTSSPHQLHRSVYQSMHNGPIYDNVKPSPGAPAPISQTTWSQPDLQRSSDVFVPLNLPRRRVSPSPVSPAQPGPPPNTPLPPIPAASAYDAKHRASRSFLAAATLPSPTSPEARTRSLTFQQPRSVPLARLIQRRLSSVPEEDLSSVAERARSPPSSPQSKLNLSQSQSQRHLPTRPSFHAPGAPSPSATALSPQTETGDDLNLGAPTAETDTATRITLQATVKLPHKPGGGKYAQGRASYRQKTSSKDGYSRGGDIKENLAATKGEDTRVAAAPKRKLRGRKVKASAATPAIVNETIKV